MTWREDLGRVTVNGLGRVIGASFRGVPFLVRASERGGGRRAVVHEFPFRDDPFVEDLGRKARPFRVEGYVIGDDYLEQRDDLLAALEDEAGPGELVHPYHGVRRAICVNLSVSETTADGGMATFALEFAETPVQGPTPSIQSDPASTVSTSADTAVTASKAELVEKYDPLGLASFALQSAERALVTAAAALGDKLSAAIDAQQELAALAGQVRVLTTQASSLVRQPAEMVDAFHAAITNLGDAMFAAPGAVMDALSETYSVDLGTAAPETTATRRRERTNQLALIAALRSIVAIEAARLAPLVPYASIEEATAARDQIAGMLEEQASAAGDTAYPGLVDLRSQVLRAVPGGAAFARIVTVTRPVAIPSLLLAYHLYGSVDQEADILARNRIRHPGFVAGDLSVISDA